MYFTYVGDNIQITLSDAEADSLAEVLWYGCEEIAAEWKNLDPKPDPSGNAEILIELIRHPPPSYQKARAEARALIEAPPNP